MKNPAQYPWRTKVEIAKEKAQSTIDKLDKKLDELDEDSDEFAVYAEIQLAVKWDVERLERIEQTFDDINRYWNEFCVPR